MAWVKTVWIVAGAALCLQSPAALALAGTVRWHWAWKSLVFIVGVVAGFFGFIALLVGLAI